MSHAAVEGALPARLVGRATPAKASHSCWVCRGGSLALVRGGTGQDGFSPADFRITDAGYGSTGDIYRCGECGFLQCPTIPDVLPFYVDMDDAAYEATRRERGLQADRLLQSISTMKPRGRLLDIGAGSGILVAAALDRGYDADGVEPSHSLCREAARRALPVHEGVLPHDAVAGPYDLVTLIDVVEHVSDPVGILTQLHNVMADDGICLIVTPDVSSLAARVMGWRWWHYRLAHVGYFNRSTLTRAAVAAGLEVVQVYRPSWYFPLGYLVARASSYLPPALRPPVPRLLDRVIVPLNLFDSLAVVCRKAKGALQVA